LAGGGSSALRWVLVRKCSAWPWRANMQPNLIERVVADERVVPFQANDPFTHTYFEFLRYFQNIDHIERHHLIISANFTYGWMPTMLKFKQVQYDLVAELLNQAKQGVQLTNPDLAAIAALINNSLVGASKLLHFVNPHVYAIWDSRVYRYLFGEKSQYHLHTPSLYQTYVHTCQQIATDSTFAPVHESINHKLGQPVTSLRAVEIIMYTGGLPQPLSTLQTTE
jgi:hypothetical protein